MKKFNYDTDKYNFKSKLEKIFDIEELASLNDDIKIFTRENDQKTHWHKLYYEWSRSQEFSSLYDNFILHYIKPIYNEEIVCQKIPTFRVAYPNNIAVGEFHKDKFYRDQSWAEYVKEDNFYLPFTNAFDTNTIWVESEEDKGDFSPMNCLYGEFIQWDGSNLMHGNKTNLTGKARVSVDFRVIKSSNYIPSEHGSMNTKSKFQIGEYYKLI
jgi:hypothetical protein